MRIPRKTEREREWNVTRVLGVAHMFSDGIFFRQLGSSEDQKAHHVGHIYGYRSACTGPALQWTNNEETTCVYLCWITGFRFHVLHLIQRNCLVPANFHHQAGALNHYHWTLRVFLNKSRPFRSFVQFLLGTCVYMSGRFLAGISKFDHFWHTWIREAEDGLWLREIGEFRVRDAVFRRVGKQ